MIEISEGRLGCVTGEGPFLWFKHKIIPFTSPTLNVVLPVVPPFKNPTLPSEYAQFKHNDCECTINAWSFITLRLSYI